MSTRKLFINIHICLAAVFLPFLLLMPLTGALYLLRYSGDLEKTPAFTISAPLPEDKAQWETFFREQFRLQNLNYDFEYIKDSGNDFIFRPASQLHYLGTKTPEGIVMTRANPALLRRLAEIHKGHGPQLMRKVEIAFGLTLICVTLSGLWLALTVPTYRKLTLVSFALGCAVIVWSVL